MVRLKVWLYRGGWYKNYPISIPYGAIKSCKRVCTQNFITCISIPYGAIKRIESRHFKSELLNISIPYGAIKSIS